MRIMTRRGGGIALGAALLMMTTAIQATAEPENGVEADAVAAIESTVGSVLDTAVPVADADAVIATADGATVDLAADPSQGLTLTSSENVDLEIGLPFADQAESAVVIEGTLVYDNNNGSTTTPLVQADGSLQILTTIADPSAPTRYEYPLDVEGVTLLVFTPTGGVDVVGSDGGVLVEVAPAWAIDANGVSLETHYEVVGNTLVQVIEHGTGTAYPVVADPKYSVGWGHYLHFNKAETRTLATQGWTATGLATACAGAASPGGPVVASAVGAACLVTFGLVVYNAGVAKNSNPEKCVYVKWTPGPGAVGTMVSGTYRDSRCK